MSHADTSIPTLEQALACVGSGGGFGSSPRDITEDEKYQKFVESMVPHCHCSNHLRPCDGVLAGGLCDGIIDEDDERFPWEDQDDAEAMDDGLDRWGNVHD